MILGKLFNFSEFSTHGDNNTLFSPQDCYHDRDETVCVRKYMTHSALAGVARWIECRPVN